MRWEAGEKISSRKAPTSVLEALGHPQNQEKWEGHWVAGSLPCSVGLGHQPSSGSCHQGDEAAGRYERQLELASAGDMRKANWWCGGQWKRTSCLEETQQIGS